MAQLREFVRSARLVAELHAERSFFLSSNGVHERSFVSAVRAFRSRRGPFSFEVRAGPRRLRSFEFEVHEIRANVKGCCGQFPPGLTAQLARHVEHS